MENLIFDEMDDRPRVIFIQENGKMEISGKSLPEDVSTFYRPVLDWMSSYARVPHSETEFTFKLTYFNTASSKLLLDILNILEKMNEEGKNVKVKWYFPEYDEDMRDAGIEYSEMVDVPFEHFSYHP